MKAAKNQNWAVEPQKTKYMHVHIHIYICTHMAADIDILFMKEILEYNHNFRRDFISCYPFTYV
jgi:hypothetical protein